MSTPLTFTKNCFCGRGWQLESNLVYFFFVVCWKCHLGNCHHANEMQNNEIRNPINGGLRVIFLSALGQKTHLFLLFFNQTVTSVRSRVFASPHWYILSDCERHGDINMKTRKGNDKELKVSHFAHWGKRKKRKVDIKMRVWKTTNEDATVLIIQTLSGGGGQVACST